jgi:hypothetical protein
VESAQVGSIERASLCLQTKCDATLAGSAYALRAMHRYYSLIIQMCYFSAPYNEISLFQKIELFSIRTSDEAKIRIMVCLVGDLKMGDYHYLQFFNILMRRALAHLDLELVGRNFYDAKAKVLHLSVYFFKSGNLALHVLHVIYVVSLSKKLCNMQISVFEYKL